MADHSRRTFLRSASIGAAAVGAVAVVPATATAATSEPEASGPAHAGPFVAWVENAASGDVVMLVGEHEVVHHDPALARRLAKVAAQAARTSS